MMKDIKKIRILQKFLNPMLSLILEAVVSIRKGVFTEYLMQTLMPIFFVLVILFFLIAAYL
jgi:hypothetical protein